MITVDTNVWVRYVTNDDPAQAVRALALLQEEPAIYLPKTVILELEWVLRAAYALPRGAITRALYQILGLPGVTCEQPEQVARALELHAQGLDLADALHLVSAASGQALRTFDAKLIRRGRRLGLPVHGV